VRLLCSYILQQKILVSGSIDIFVYISRMLTDKPLIKSVRDNANSILGREFLAVVLAVLAVYFTVDGFLDIYPELNILALGFFAALAAVATILPVLSMYDLLIYEDRFEANPVIGKITKTVMLSEINTWEEYEESDKYGTWNNLRIITAKQVFLLSSNQFRNYDEVKKYLTIGKPALTSPPRKLRLSGSDYLWISIVVLVIVLLFNLPFIKNTPDGKLISAMVVTASGPYIENGKGGSYIDLKLDQYPEFDFSLALNPSTMERAHRMVAMINSHDTIEIFLPEDVYLKKLVKSKPLTFSDKTIDYRFIQIFGIRFYNESIGLTGVSGQ
jgi:hypothetical protein